VALALFARATSKWLSDIDPFTSASATQNHSNNSRFFVEYTDGIK
jgi:hypothetical protein